RLDERRAHAECVPHGLRPLRVSLGEVVVDRDEVSVVAGEGVQIERLHRHGGLAVARAHLGDVALVENDSTHPLHLEEADAHRPAERLPDGCEGLEDELVDRLSVLDPLLELNGLAGQLGVGERLELRLERADVGRLFGEPLQPAALAEAKGLLERAELGHETRVAGRPRGPGLRGPSERARFDLPEPVAEPPRAHNVRLADALAQSLDLREAAENALAVDRERALAPAYRQLELVTADLELRYLDSTRGDRPAVAVATHRLGPVGRVEDLFDRLRQRRRRFLRLVLVHDQVAVRQPDE